MLSLADAALAGKSASVPSGVVKIIKFTPDPSAKRPETKPPAVDDSAPVAAKKPKALSLKPSVR